MKKQSFSFDYLIANFEQLGEDDQQLLLAAHQSAATAYAPYSKFRVGTSVLLDNKEMVLGNNQENMAYPSGLCAERVALFYAHARYPNSKITKIGISFIPLNDEEKQPLIAPCGACRQVMSEYQINQNAKITTYLWNGDKQGEIIVLEDVNDLLPFTFWNADLRK